jgi:hypothetical protein
MIISINMIFRSCLKMESPITEKKSNGIAPVVGIGLVLFGALTLLSRFVPGVGQFMWGAFFAGGGGFIYHRYLQDKSRWWMLIPAYGLISLGGLLFLTLLTDALGMIMPSADFFIPAYIMAAMAVPFAWLYREQKLPLPIALIGAPFALMSAGFLLGAVGPIIPAILIIVGLYLIMRQTGFKLPGMSQAASAPAPIKEIAPSRIEPIFEPLNIPTAVTAKPTSGPAADR